MACRLLPLLDWARQRWGGDVSGRSVGLLQRRWGERGGVQVVSQPLELHEVRFTVRGRAARRHGVSVAEGEGFRDRTCPR